MTFKYGGKGKKAGAQIDINSILKTAINQQFNDVYTTSNSGLVDILTFARDYLKIRFEERPYLKLILKMFYMNTPGNECLRITDEDIDLIKRINNYKQPYAPEEFDPSFDYETLDEFPNGNPWLLEKAIKLKNGVITEPFQTLVLVLGRRAGKTFTASMIISYETYKLLNMNVCPECTNIQNVLPGEFCPECLEKGIHIKTEKHPQSYYKLRGSEPIRILLAATRLGQAVDPGLMFFKERIRECAFFDGKYLPEAESIYFASDHDLAMNERLQAQGLPAEKGSVKVMAVASNPNGLHGLGSSVVLLDEFALFNTEGKDTDSAFLEALLPQVLKYRKKNDGRIIMISMPDKEQGEFWEHYCKAQEHDDKADKILMMQMPTWEFAKDESRAGCQAILSTGSEKDADGISFDKLFGAQFQNSGGEQYFADMLVEIAFNNHDNLFRVQAPVNHQNRHFMHIDCAFNSDSYAFCIMHMERRFCPMTQKMEPYFVQDDSYHWTPNKNLHYSAGNPQDIQMFVGERGETVNIYEILKTIADRAKTFRCQAVSYDTIQSVESISYFRQRGLTLRQISFAGQSKSKIYQIARIALHGQRIILCNDDRQLRKEMRELRVSFTRRGPVIEKPQGGSDDVCDCMVGAIYLSNQKISKQFARPMAVMAGVPNHSGGGVGMPAMHGANGMPAGGRLMGAGQSLFSRFNATTAYNGGY